MQQRPASKPSHAVTVTLNPAIDQTLQIPRFAAGRVNRVQRVSEHPGGKGVNVAAALSDFGVGVAVTGFLGRENAGSFEAMFADRGLKDRFIRIPGQTRTGIKITDSVGRQTTDINFPGLAPRRSDVVALTRILHGLASPGRWFVLSGSLPPGLDTRTYARLVAVLKKGGARVVLDTSGEPLRAAVQERPDIIKPNREELEALVGRKLSGTADIVRAVRPLLAMGIEVAVVSLGEQGACFVTPERSVIARPPKVEVASTVGAGDAMVAGLVVAQLKGKSLEDTARMATAFSLEVVTRGQSGLGSRAAIGRWAQRVTCTNTMHRTKR